MYKPIETQIATSFEADFEERTWTFKMQDKYAVAAGEFVIMDKAVYDDFKIAASDVLCSFTYNGKLPEDLADALNRLAQLLHSEQNLGEAGNGASQPKPNSITAPD